MSARVSLELTPDQALVFDAFLARFDETDQLQITCAAEYLVIVKIAAQLEKALSEPFRADYVQLLSDAKARLEEGYEGEVPGLGSDAT